jgi:predicted metalloprotease with PDZ domain
LNGYLESTALISTTDCPAAAHAVPLVLRLTVDATDFQRAIISVREEISVRGPGLLTLLYPEWIPGYHAPEAPIELVAGLRFRSGDEELEWSRDPVNIHAFHIAVPPDCQKIEVFFQILTPTESSQGRVGFTPNHLNLQWNAVLLYPAGYRADQLGVAAQVRLPAGWSNACALERRSNSHDVLEFEPATVERVVDSPLFAGPHYQRYHVDASRKVTLDVFGDKPEQVEVGGSVRYVERLISEADALFGSRPFDRYDFLVAVSDELESAGVEHGRSSELVFPGGFFSQWNATSSKNDILAHEYVHAWNGKFRQGKDSRTETYNQPIGNSLLWVYEGLTQYWGRVLAVRSGLWDAETFLAALARAAAEAELAVGRRWRPLRDTMHDPIIAARQKGPWPSWQSSERYYTDGSLIWLDVDTKLRELSQNSRSLDDFGRLFFGVQNQKQGSLTYDFEDVTDALSEIADFDWSSYFQRHLSAVGGQAPINGDANGGYALVYREEPSAFQKKDDALTEVFDLRFSVGLRVKADGKIDEVIWDSPAFQAGATAGGVILAVNSNSFSLEVLQDAIGHTLVSGLVELMVRRLKHVERLAICYDGGHRYPHLEPVTGARRLDDIAKSRL